MVLPQVTTQVLRWIIPWETRKVNAYMDCMLGHIFSDSPFMNVRLVVVQLAETQLDDIHLAP